MSQAFERRLRAAEQAVVADSGPEHWARSIVDEADTPEAVQQAEELVIEEYRQRMRLPAERTINVIRRVIVSPKRGVAS